MYSKYLDAGERTGENEEARVDDPHEGAHQDVMVGKIAALVEQRF